MATFATVKITNSRLGTVTVKVDKEDKAFLLEGRPYIHNSNADNFYVRFTYNGIPAELANRAILASHEMLDVSKNLKPKNGDHFDLRKKNWV